MTKELQDLAWSVLPKEFKEEVKEEYFACKHCSAEASAMELEIIFGEHNLTSDAEGDEMLTCVKDRAVKLYNIANKAYAINGVKYYQGYMNAMIDLFGSKCLPDEEEKMTEERYQYLNSLSLEDYDNETSADEQRQFCEYQHKHHPDEVIYLQTYSDEKPQPAEPKFKEGDRAIYCIPEKQRIKARVVNVRQRSGSTLFNTLFNYDIRLDDGRTANWVDEQWLLPDNDDQVRAVTEKDSEQFDRIIKDDFKKQNRLNIAAMAMAGMLASSVDYHIDDIVKFSLEYADALIAAAEKGGCQ